MERKCKFCGKKFEKNLNNKFKGYTKYCCYRCYVKNCSKSIMYKYNNDTEYNKAIKQRKKELWDKNKIENNKKRRERYATDKEYKKRISEYKKKQPYKDKKNKSRNNKYNNNSEYKKKENDRSKEYYKNNKLKVNTKVKEYRENNKEKIRTYHRERRHNNLYYKIRHTIESRIRIALKRNTKSNKSTKLLGTTILYYKKYLENQFTDEMSWDNYGDVWEIDHIIPISWYNLSLQSHQLRAFHYTNTKPMLSDENRTKGARTCNPTITQWLDEVNQQVLISHGVY